MIILGWVVVLAVVVFYQVIDNIRYLVKLYKEEKIKYLDYVAQAAHSTES